MPDPNDIPYVSTVKRLTSIDEIRDVPVIGGLYGTANTVIDYFESDCHPDWYVYAETLFPALGQAVLVLLTFGLDDVLRGYLRPGGGRGFGGLGRASRRPRRLTKAARARGLLKGGIPEIGELLGRHLPGAETVRARPVGGTEKFLWKLDGLAQRGLWYWMIADVLEDFTINWTTALYRSDACIGIDVAGVERVQDNHAIPPEATFATTQVAIVVNEWGPVTHTNISVTCPDGMQGFLAWSANVKDFLFPHGNVELMIALSNNSNVIARSGPTTIDPVSGLPSAAVTARMESGKTYFWGFSNDGPNAILDDCIVTALFQPAH